MEPWTGQVSMSFGNYAGHLVAPHVPPTPGLTVRELARLILIVAYFVATFPNLMVHFLAAPAKPDLQD